MLPRRRAPLVHPLLAFVLALVAVAPPLVRSGAVTDKYVPACATYSDPPPSGWLRWSDPDTWPSKTVPGVGANAGADVSIPCNTGVLLDANITVGTLTILGSLKVEDLGPFQVFANFIVNQGRVLIGSPLAPYVGKLIVNITGSTDEYIIKRAPDNATAPAEAPRSLGTRAVITLGGTWDVNGMYGNNPGWTTLSQNAKIGDTSITVKGNVGAWPVGGEIAIASTDFDYKQAERLKITSVTVSGSTTVLGLSSPLKWGHWGNPVATGIADVSMDQSAEVMLLTRSIVFQGHPNPIDPLIGGHFIIVQTPAKQSVIGIELNNMGQQGRLARYPFHFHLCQDVSGSLAKALSVHDSNQRCYVVHGSWNARLEGNGAFRNKGHCYIVEDGIEFNNTFIGNLGFYTEAPQRTPDVSNEALKPLFSDAAPSTFWITNPNNSWINNVAAGGVDSGWWFEAMGSVAGPSQLFPGANKVYPKHIAVVQFSGNSAHSYGRAGLRTYPSGYRPKVNGGYSLDQSKSGPNAAPMVSYVNGFRAYKNMFIGMFIHETDTMVFDNLMVADNGQVGLELNRAQGITIRNSIFLGETENPGNPTVCGVRQSGCRPNLTPSSADAFIVSGTGPCAFPKSNDPSVARSYPQDLLSNGDLFGILMDSDDFPSHGTQGAPFTFSNLTFGKFYSYCRNAAAGITANGGEAAIWTAAHSSTGMKVIDGSAAVWMVQPKEGHLGFEPSGGDAGGMSYFYTWRDVDGSLVGGSGGYVVTANSPAILPVGSACTEKPAWNAYACPGACYRTLSIQGGAYTITRTDGMEISSEGSQFVNLAANTPYRITFTGTPPATFSVSYMDYDSGCTQPVVLHFVNPEGSRYEVAPGNNQFWQACNGVTVPFEWVTQTRYLCVGSTRILQVTMGSSYKRTLKVSLQPGSPPDCAYLQCGVFMAQAAWSFNDSGVRPSDFLTMVKRPRNWKVGKAMFGFGGVGENSTIAMPGPSMLATYFRQSFTLAHAGCINQLLFGYIADDAMVVYINGGEAFRTNLPDAPNVIKPSTAALADVSPKAGWSQYVVSTDNLWLQSGTNHIMVELHTASARAMSARFDMWVAAVGQNCPGSQFFSVQGQAPIRRSSS